MHQEKNAILTSHHRMNKLNIEKDIIRKQRENQHTTSVCSIMMIQICIKVSRFTYMNHSLIREQPSQNRIANLRISSQNYVSPPSGHISGDGDGIFSSCLGNNFSLPSSILRTNNRNVTTTMIKDVLTYSTKKIQQNNKQFFPVSDS